MFYILLYENLHKDVVLSDKANFAEVVYCMSFCCSSLTSASIAVPYIRGMRLGDSFDYSSFKVGNNLIQSDVRNKAVERRNERSYMKFKLIKSQKDKKDVLDISGELSLKVMAGLVDVKGKGAYLKSTTSSGNSVELLVQIYYRTVSFLNSFFFGVQYLGLPVTHLFMVYITFSDITNEDFICKLNTLS